MKPRQLIPALAILLALGAGAAPAHAQAVVAMVNGQPITTFDVDQRIRLAQLTSRERLGRDDALKLLIDDRIKVQEARRTGYRITDANIDDSVERVARSNRQTPEQFSEALRRAGIAPNFYRQKLEADVAWDVLLRNRLRRGTNLTNDDLEAAMAEAEAKGRSKVTDYTVHTVIFVVPSSSGPGGAVQRQRDAEAARGRFQGCESGLADLARLRDVAVRPPVTRSSNELPPPVAELLAKTKVDSLTTPSRTTQGIEMLALCDKRERTDSAGMRAAVEAEMAQKRSREIEQAYLAELREKAQITRR